MSAIITITETTRVEAFWIVGWGLGDWLAVVYRDTADSPWRATSRFRHYAATKVWESGDRKVAYEIAPVAEADLGGLCDNLDVAAAGLATLLRQEMPGRAVKVIKRIIRGDAEAFTAEFMKTGFAHTLTVPTAAGPDRPQ